MAMKGIAGAIGPENDVIGCSGKRQYSAKSRRGTKGAIAFAQPGMSVSATHYQ